MTRGLGLLNVESMDDRRTAGKFTENPLGGGSACQVCLECSFIHQSKYVLSEEVWIFLGRKDAT